MKFLLAFFILPITVIGLILFNAWYLQVLYNIGLTTIFEQFGVMLPQINYWIFVFINITFACLYTLFKQNGDKLISVDSKSNKSFAESFSPIVGNILTKLAQLGLLMIAYHIYF